MKITFDWLKDHLKTNLKEKNLLEQLTNIGLEVESVESLSTLSTSSPILVSCSKRFFSFRLVFK